MRSKKGLVELAKAAFQKGKVIAAICHGAQLLIEADIFKGKRAICHVAVATDLKNAGNIYEDSPQLL